MISKRLDPLTSAAVVFRGRVGASEDVVGLVSSFLDFAIPERWSIDRACEEGFGLRMLKRLAVHEASDEASGTASSVDPFYRAYLASKGLIAAIRRADDVDVVRWICCEYCPSVVPVHAMVEAASQGRLCVLQWLFDKYSSVRPNAYLAKRALEGCHLEVLRWLLVRLELSVEAEAQMLSDGAKLGYLEIVQWLHARHCQLGAALALADTDAGQSALGNAIESGHFGVTKFLSRQGYHLDRRFTSALEEVAVTADPETIKWLNGERRWQVRNIVVRGGLEMIKWLHARKFTKHTVGWIDMAAAAGHLNILKWIQTNIPGDVCTADAFDDAAKGGHLEVLQWLHANWIVEISVWAMDHAAEMGHLDTVKWLHENRTEGCTHWAMDEAAKNGHLDVVRWLHVNRTEGCTVSAMDEASKSGHFEVVKWLHANRTEGCTRFAMEYAAGSGHLQIVQWLHQNRTEGCTTQAMDLAAKNGHLHVVRWLHENRNEGCSADTMDYAQSVEVLQWLLDHRAEGCTSWAAENAAFLGLFEKLLWLNDNNLSVFTQMTAFAAADKFNFEICQWLRANFQMRIGGVSALHSDDVQRRCFWEMFFQVESAGRF